MERAIKGDLAKRLADAKAEVERLERQAGAATCAEMGEHDWKLLGGRNAGCRHDGCGCSVPVSVCTRCGDCDYGDTPEGQEIIRACAERSE